MTRTATTRTAATTTCAALCALMAMLVAGAAPAAGRADQPVARAALPAGFVVGSGDPPLGLAVVVDDGVVSSSVPAGATAANVHASGVIEDGGATLSIRHDLPVALKFDLYVSLDGETFRRASSCAVTPGISSFELWQRPVRAFALGNPRVVDGNRAACD